MSCGRAVLAALAVLLLVLLPVSSVVPPAGGVWPAPPASLVGPPESAAAAAASNEQARKPPPAAAGRLGTRAGGGPLPPIDPQEGRPAVSGSAGRSRASACRLRSHRNQAHFSHEDPAEPDGDDDPPTAAAFRLASFGTWRRVYVASLHTKPDQQGRAFQLTLPDPWATGCYTVDISAASFSELHRDFRLEIFTAEECREEGNPAMLPPAPGPNRNAAAAEEDLVRDLCPDCRRARHTRGNFLKPVRVRSVRFHHVP